MYAFNSTQFVSLRESTADVLCVGKGKVSFFFCLCFFKSCADLGLKLGLRGYKQVIGDCGCITSKVFYSLLCRSKFLLLFNFFESMFELKMKLNGFLTFSKDIKHMSRTLVQYKSLIKKSHVNISQARLENVMSKKMGEYFTILKSFFVFAFMLDEAFVQFSLDSRFSFPRSHQSWNESCAMLSSVSLPLTN